VGRYVVALLLSACAGFTITNGSGNLFLPPSRNKEQSCRGSIFASPEVERYCGGIVVDCAWPTITHNVITGNRVRHGDDGNFVTSGAFPTIRNNTITANTASAGAGLFVNRPKATDCTRERNPWLFYYLEIDWLLRPPSSTWGRKPAYCQTT
jgi:hypothetical protein